MDHVVCLDAGAHEFENLVNGNKSMILRGGDNRNHSYGSVEVGDTLYFINCVGEDDVLGKGMVSYVFKSDRLSEEESYETIIRHQDKLQLPDSQFYSLAGKRYLVLIGVKEVHNISPFRIDISKITAGNDWLAVGNIDRIFIRHAV